MCVAGCSWFLGAPFDSLKRGNIEDFVAYGFFCKRPKDLSPEVQKELVLGKVALLGVVAVLKAVFCGSGCTDAPAGPGLRLQGGGDVGRAL